MNEVIKLLDDIRKEWSTSLDPVIMYRTGQFEEKEEVMNEHISRMNVLMNKAWWIIESAQQQIKEASEQHTTGKG